MVNSHLSHKPISLATQVLVMKQRFPNFSVRWHKNIVYWIGEVQPTSLSKRYLIRIIHQLHSVPQVFVLRPKLEETDSGPVPHTYPDNRLCLYRPRKHEWSHQKLIAETIVPWVSLWLYYYEVWQVTREWLGGGEHPQVGHAAKSPINIIRQLDSEGAND